MCKFYPQWQAQSDIDHACLSPHIFHAHTLKRWMKGFNVQEDPRRKIREEGVPLQKIRV